MGVSLHFTAWDSFAEVRPRGSLDDIVNGGFPNGISFADVLARQPRSVQSFDLKHICFGHFGFWVSFSFVRFVQDFISVIRALCIPSQVAPVIVVWVSVIVARFHSLGARSYEGFEDQSVNESVLSDSSYRHNYMSVLDSSSGVTWLDFSPDFSKFVTESLVLPACIPTAEYISVFANCITGELDEVSNLAANLGEFGESGVHCVFAPFFRVWNDSTQNVRCSQWLN